MSKMRLLGMPVSFIVMAVMFAAAIFIMQRTTLGVKVHAIGYNPKASSYSGIHTDRIKFWLFVLSGTVAAIASSFMLMRFGSAESEFAGGYDTRSLTAVLLWRHQHQRRLRKHAGYALGADRGRLADQRADPSGHVVHQPAVRPGHPDRAFGHQLEAKEQVIPNAKALE